MTMKQLLISVACLALTAASAVSQTGSSKPPAQLSAEVNLYFLDQNSGLIIPYNARQTLLDMIASSTTAANPIFIGSNGGTSGSLVLNGSTSGNTQLLANSTGGLNIQPTLGQGIFLDDNNLTVLQVLGVGAGAVNGLYVKNAAPGNPAVIGAIGSDANIGIQMIAKGSAGQLGFQIINGGGGSTLVPMQAGGTNSGTGEVVLSGNVSGSLSMVGTPTGGHVAFASSSTPTLGVCNGAGSALFGTDTVGAVTGQTAVATQCTVTFGTAYANPPFCTVSGETAPPTSYSATASVLTVNFSSVTLYKFVWQCFGL